jgi:hypothetical protein
MWYYIRYYWKFYLSGINEIYDFFISIFFICPVMIWPIFSNFKKIFSFQFQKWKFSIFSFQISVLYIFFISLWWYGQIYSNFKIDFFSKFSISLWWYGQKNFEVQKQKISIQVSKIFFFISNFPCGRNNFFLYPRLPNLLKDCNNHLFTLTKNCYYYISPPGAMIHRKRTQ